MRLATGLILITLGVIFLASAYFSFWPFSGSNTGTKWRTGAAVYRIGLATTSIASIIIGALYLAQVF